MRITRFRECEGMVEMVRSCVCVRIITTFVAHNFVDWTSALRAVRRFAIEILRRVGI